MNLKEYMGFIRAKIGSRIERELSQFSSTCKGRGSELEYVFPSLIDYCISGKMLRGALVCMGSSLFSTSAEPKADALDIAAAMELLQSGLLVHDDIMDKDDTRRGRPTMHRLFEQAEFSSSKTPLKTLKSTNLTSLGESLGICAGDIYYFIAWKLINTHNSVIGECISRELVDVCLAQMRDVREGVFLEFPSMPEILDVYAYKTARYTVTLPLCCGALLEGHNEVLPLIEELGLNLGILFQLQDDYLGLFGDSNTIGKPIGSDLREGKKTPFMILLQPRLSTEEKVRFSGFFGHDKITQDDIEFTRNLIREYKIDKEIKTMSEAYASKAKAALSALSVADGVVTGSSTDCFSLLSEFIDYSLDRTR